jgi:hypothetical protein
MPNLATHVPAETDLLCEHCGYTLNGLPLDSRCPECGNLIADSSTSHRQPSAWDQSKDLATGLRGFFQTTAAVLLWPNRFFRHLTVQESRIGSMTFAFAHWMVISMLLGSAIRVHILLNTQIGPWPKLYIFVILVISFINLLIPAALWLNTFLAAKLTAWEAAYRGLRLPYPVVRRAMHFHAAHYLPVSLVAFATVMGYRYLLLYGVVGSSNTMMSYLYTLSAEVIAGAAYLFLTYWAAMRNLLYANR